MAALQLPNCKKKSAAHKNGFEVLVFIISPVSAYKIQVVCFVQLQEQLNRLIYCLLGLKSLLW